MKKLYFTIIIFALCGYLVFGDNNRQEEVASLLFMPNSGTRFANEEQAFIQLNKLAEYLLNKNLRPGQILVYGYAASAPNDIKSVDLSIERALTVMTELQKRGVSRELFADPVGHGAVYLWGNNANENDRRLNRRVRVLLDGETPMPVTNEIINAQTETPKAETVNPVIVREKHAAPKVVPKESTFKFSWWLLPLLAMLFLLFLLLLLLLGEKPSKAAHKTETVKEQAPITEIEPGFAPEAAVTTWTVNLDDEIRFRAYELSLQRGGSGDYREQDWYNAVHEISTWYTACGHSVYSNNGSWWASRTYSYNFPGTVAS